MREILHIDMDAFYASVEIADQPFLAGKPVIVGGYKVVEPAAGGGERVSGRGVVCAASYEARRFGVRSAMPMAEAIRRCPQAILLPVRMRRYAEFSSKVFEIFHRFTPLVQGLSLDEAFLDVTASRALFGDGVAIAHQIRDAIRDELGLVASAGVAPTKFVAKIASDLEKPNALVDFREDVKERLAPLPTTRLWGVGGKSLPRLEALGLRTFGDFQEAPDDWLRKTIGEVGVHYKLLASGIDGRPVVPEREAKSIGSETTYEEDLRGREDVGRALLEHSETVAARLVRNGLAGRTLAIKLKTDRFELISRQTPLGEPASDTTTLFRAAEKALDRLPLDGRAFRLVGVHVSDLAPSNARPTLFQDAEKIRRDRLQKTLQAIGDKLGPEGHGALTRATLLGRKRRPTR